MFLCNQLYLQESLTMKWKQLMQDVGCVGERCMTK